MREVFSRRNFKRNAALSAVLLFVCGAAWLNWSFNDRWGKADNTMVKAEDKMTAAVQNSEEVSSVLSAGKAGGEEGEYFAKARLTRQESRDAALSLLETAACSEGASQEVIDSAMTKISVMASWSMLENQIENELLAKDFADCVVYLSSEGCTVAVPAPVDGLPQEDVAKVTETVIANSGFSATDINIIEVTTW